MNEKNDLIIAINNPKLLQHTQNNIDKNSHGIEINNGDKQAEDGYKKNIHKNQGFAANSRKRI